MCLLHTWCVWTTHVLLHFMVFSNGLPFQAFLCCWYSSVYYLLEAAHGSLHLFRCWPYSLNLTFPARLNYLWLLIGLLPVKFGWHCSLSSICLFFHNELNVFYLWCFLYHFIPTESHRAMNLYGKYAGPSAHSDYSTPHLILFGVFHTLFHFNFVYRSL